MEETSTTFVPLGSLAIVFAVISILVLIKKNINAREADEIIKIRMIEKRSMKNRSLNEQKKLLEEILRK